MYSKPCRYNSHPLVYVNIYFFSLLLLLLCCGIKYHQVRHRTRAVVRALANLTPGYKSRVPLSLIPPPGGAIRAVSVRYARGESDALPLNVIPTPFRLRSKRLCRAPTSEPKRRNTNDLTSYANYCYGVTTNIAGIRRIILLLFFSLNRRNISARSSDPRAVHIVIGT